MIPFDLMQVPLRGVRLIEAGAGTGKTYNIEGLFLRLILEPRLPVEQIVVLTFTVAATAELRDRIRRRLVRLRTVLTEGVDHGKDPLITGLFQAVTDQKQALRAVDAAVSDFDRAAVHTIHGFCHRLLTEHAVETGTLFDTEIAVDPTPLIDEAAADFWRRHLHDAPPELAAFLFEQKTRGPDAFSALYRRLRKPAEMRISGRLEAKPELARLEAFRAQTEALKSEWQRQRERVRNALMDPVLKGNLYGSVAENPAGSGLSRRKERVDALIQSMDRHLSPDSLAFPLFADFHRFTDDAIRAGTRKGMSPPQLTFFEACGRILETAEELRLEMERFRLWLKTEFVATAPERLKGHKRRKNVLFYDDLLTRVRDALRENPGFAEAAARRYKAALVDEFQDTDAVQYEICRGLFGDDRGPLFMIGDPKQAIYGFRGADVFSYLAAAKSAEQRYSLAWNWRSDPGLVRGVNELFSLASRPFLLEGIPFAPARPARTERCAAGPGLSLCLLSSDAGRPAAKSDAVPRLARWAADEIGGLINGGRPAGQIAVLVRTNRQAQIVKSILSQRRIPAVLYSTGSVFGSSEAEELQRLLSGVRRPLDLRRVRAALCTRLLGESAQSLQAGESDASWWPQKTAQFVDARRIWSEGGFIRMIHRFMDQEGIRRRLLTHPSGERMLTNLLHLVELCHRAETERNLSPAGLIQWISRKRQATFHDADEEQLRLESDAAAVQVVTVHRSKGLEFPIVFIPFGWSADASRVSEELVFHDPEAGDRLTVDLGGRQRDRSARLARTETLAEDLRLLYVAVTRAVERCYLAWGRINQAERSSLAYLFYGPALKGNPDPVEALARHVKGLSDADFHAPLKRLESAAGGDVFLCRIEEEAHPTSVRQEGEKPALSVRRFSGTIDRSWRVASYSHLAASPGVRFGPGEIEQPDRDRVGAGPESVSDGPEEGDRRDILTFPGGVRAGHFFHELLENAPFSPDGKEERRRLAALKLRQYGFEEHWQKAVCEGIQRVLAAPLAAEPPDLRLEAIPRAHRLHELAFFFPLQQVSPEDLEALLPSFSAAGQEKTPGSRLHFSPVRGVLKGYIDLVFFHRGRYYLVDWKSNYLGPDRKGYDPGALSRVMREARYDLQYTLYCLALDLYLRKKDAEYRYETGFGGAFYLFLRGMHPEAENRPGVFFDRPKASLLVRLRDRLVAWPPDI